MSEVQQYGEARRSLTLPLPLSGRGRRDLGGLVGNPIAIFSGRGGLNCLPALGKYVHGSVYALVFWGILGQFGLLTVVFFEG